MRQRALVRRIEALEARIETRTGESPHQDPAAYWETVLGLPRRAANDQADEAEAEASLCRRCRHAVRTVTAGRPHVICLVLPDSAICPDRHADRFFAGVPQVTVCDRFQPTADAASPRSQETR